MKGRVLVIEDDADVALGIQTVLSRSGYDVASSADGRQGLRDFHARRPDLVVLDIGLPSLDGWEVLERIRDMSDVPVLLLTARGHEGDKVRGLDGGADDYLTKPFGNRELAARVHALLRRPRTQREDADSYDDGTVLIAAAACEMHPTAVLKGMGLRSVIGGLRDAGERARVAGVDALPAIQVGDEIFCGADALDGATAALMALP